MVPLLLSLAGVCADDTVVDDETSSAELALLEDVDEVRENEGLPPLERDYALGLVARDYSREMARAQSVEHGLADSLPERVRPVAPDTCVFAENLARHVDVAAVVPGWLASESHRRNLLDPELRRSGMGVVRGADGYLYVTHLFAGPC